MLQLPGDVHVAFTHLAALGLGSILEDAGCRGVGIHWTGSLDARPLLTAPGLDWDVAARSVREHAVAHAAPDDWTAATVGGVAGGAGLMSPRIKPPTHEDGWVALVEERRSVIDRQMRSRHLLDLALIGALGEPAYWRVDTEGVRRPDEGASRWELKTRNRGEDFVAHRLRRLAIIVAARDPRSVRDGLTGDCVVDELGKDAVDGRTATGLAGLGPVDNALAWCALWGISAFAVTPQVVRGSRTAGHLPRRRGGAGRREECFYLPIPSRPISLPRFRHIASSASLQNVLEADLDADAAHLNADSGRSWLLARHIGAVVRFPIGVFGSASAPERRALIGTVIRLRP